MHVGGCYFVVCVVCYTKCFIIVWNINRYVEQASCDKYTTAGLNKKTSHLRIQNGRGLLRPTLPPNTKPWLLHRRSGNHRTISWVVVHNNEHAVERRGIRCARDVSLFESMEPALLPVQLNTAQRASAQSASLMRKNATDHCHIRFTSILMLIVGFEVVEYSARS